MRRDIGLGANLELVFHNSYKKLHSLQLFLFREQPKCGAINGIGLDGWDVSPGRVRNRAPYGANKNPTEKVIEP